MYTKKSIPNQLQSDIWFGNWKPTIGEQGQTLTYTVHKWKPKNKHIIQPFPEAVVSLMMITNA